jgi:hypothetical protein
MSYEELRAKFDENAAGVLSADARDHLADAIAHLENSADASRVVDLSLNLQK